jgi:hypothetical protein
MHRPVVLQGGLLGTTVPVEVMSASWSHCRSRGYLLGRFFGAQRRQGRCGGHLRTGRHAKRQRSGRPPDQTHALSVVPSARVSATTIRILSTDARSRALAYGTCSQPLFEMDSIAHSDPPCSGDPSEPIPSFRGGKVSNRTKHSREPQQASLRTGGSYRPGTPVTPSQAKAVTRRLP